MSTWLTPDARDTPTRQRVLVASRLLRMRIFGVDDRSRRPITGW